MRRNPRRGAPLGSAIAVGLALGSAVGAAAAFHPHDYLFALPTIYPENALGWLLRASGRLGLPLARDPAMLLLHAAAGALAGAVGGVALTLIPAVRRGSFAQPFALGPLAALLGAPLILAVWQRRGVAGGLPALAVVTVGLAAAGALGGALLVALGRAIAAQARPAASLGALGVLAAAGVAATAPRLPEVPAGAGPVRAPRPLLLIGVDAASFANLETQLEAGALPNLARLRARGAHGELQSIHPTFSPIVWTTIVTGAPREAHGILDFTLNGVPYTSNSRTALALWEILPRFGQRSAFHTWWASWPAEAVDGRIVTDRLEDRELDGRVHPPEALGRLEALAAAARVGAPPASRLLGPGGDRLDAAFAARHAERLGVLRRFLARDAAQTALGIDALETGFDLTAVYLRLLDAVGHKFWRWHYHEIAPSLARVVYGPPGADQAILGPVVRRAHEIVDEQIGRLLSAAGPDVNVVIVSDHGMTTSVPVHAAPGEDGETGTHHRSGMLLLAGPDLRPVRIRGASVYDVFPTLLHLLGLPVPEDAPGRVLVEALRPGVRRERPLRRVASFGPRETEDTRPIATDADRGYLEQLEALGYVVD